MSDSTDSSSVSKGVSEQRAINPDSLQRLQQNRRTLSTQELIDGIKNGHRSILSRAITLAESTRATDQQQAQDVIEACMPRTGNSLRVGITGVPGVGKSTFIEALGNHLITKGHKLAVLTIDPTSTRTKGSILGDKTRMDTLAASEDAFIRPSPTAGSLGGVARKSRETMYLCEAAGYDIIFIETVGVGQSETAVHSMVDFFLLLMLPGAGDELQGIKRGIIEMADAIAVNKIDNHPPKQVNRAMNEYKNALHLYPPTNSGWEPRVTSCSAFKKKGIDDIWTIIQEYHSLTKENGFFEQNRKQQARHWMMETIEHSLKDHFYSHERVREAMQQTKQAVLNGSMSSFKAAQKLLDIYKGER